MPRSARTAELQNGSAAFDCQDGQLSRAWQRVAQGLRLGFGSREVFSSKRGILFVPHEIIEPVGCRSIAQFFSVAYAGLLR